MLNVVELSEKYQKLPLSLNAKGWMLRFSSSFDSMIGKSSRVMSFRKNVLGFRIRWKSLQDRVDSQAREPLCSL